MNHNGYADTSFGTNGLVINEMETNEFTEGLALSPREDVLYFLGNVETDWTYIVAAYYTGYENTPPVSLNENTQGAISIFPNPTSGMVSIETGMAGRHLLQVYDVMGKELFRSDWQGKKFDINLEPLQCAVYILKVTLPDNNIRASRIIKQ
jgi:hypothetical protein